MDALSSSSSNYQTYTPRESGEAEDVDQGVEDAGEPESAELPTDTQDSVELSGDSGEAEEGPQLGGFADNFSAQAPAEDGPAEQPGAPAADQPDQAQQPAAPAGPAAPAAPEQPAQPKAEAKPDPYFKYDGVPWKDHSASIGWTPGSKRESPVQANEAITEGYKNLNEAMQRYLAGDPNGAKLPPLADWSTFGKYASREAGEQIRNMQDATTFLHNGDIEAARRLQKNMTNPESIEQALALAKDRFGDSVAGANPVNAALNPLNETGKVAGNAVGDLAFTTPNTMLDALTRGNNGIYNNFAPAYDAFLKGEANGTGGIKALEEAGYKPGSKEDPQGFIHGALSDYKQARELGLQAQQEKDPAKRDALLAQRQALVEKANLNLGNQEQIEVIQKPGVFGNPEVAKRIGSLGGTMNIHDANGTFPLLPNGGNWADFATRMGYKEVPPGTAGAMNIRHPDGKMHTYQVDPNAKGTISDYFTQNLSGPRADKLNRSNPAPLDSPSTINSGYQADMLARDLNRGNYSAAVGKAASLPVIAGGDLAAFGGKELSQSGDAVANTGANRLVRGYASGSPMQMLRGTAELGAGTVVGTGGRVLKSAGENISFGGQVIGTLWDMARGR